MNEYKRHRCDLFVANYRFLTKAKFNQKTDQNAGGATC